MTCQLTARPPHDQVDLSGLKGPYLRARGKHLTTSGAFTPIHSLRCVPAGRNIRPTSIRWYGAHRSARQSLLLGSSVDRIEDVEREEGRALLRNCALGAHTLSSSIAMNGKGDLVVRDNTGTMHQVEPFPEVSKRLMCRVTLEGKE